MSIKQPRCLTTMGDLPHSCFKTLLGYMRTHLSVYNTKFERFFGNGTLHVCYTCSKDLTHGTPDGPLLTNGGHKSERGLCGFERETTATAGCLVDISGSLRTNPNMELKASGYGLLIFDKNVSPFSSNFMFCMCQQIFS